MGRGGEFAQQVVQFHRFPWFTKRLLVLTPTILRIFFTRRKLEVQSKASKREASAGSERLITLIISVDFCKHWSCTQRLLSLVRSLPSRPARVDQSAGTPSMEVEASVPVEAFICFPVTVSTTLSSTLKMTLGAQSPAYFPQDRSDTASPSLSRGMIISELQKHVVLRVLSSEGQIGASDDVSNLLTHDKTPILHLSLSKASALRKSHIPKKSI